MEEYEKYTKILESINKTKMANRSNSNVDKKRFRLISNYQLRLFGDIIYIDAYILDMSTNKEQVVGMIYDPEHKTSTEIVMPMISSFAFSSDPASYLDFIVVGPLDDFYYIQDFLIAKN